MLKNIKMMMKLQIILEVLSTPSTRLRSRSKMTTLIRKKLICRDLIYMSLSTNLAVVMTSMNNIIETSKFNLIFLRGRS